MMTSLTKSDTDILPLLAATLLSWAAIVLLPLFPLQDYDTFWHLAYGRAMLESGQFINHEIFSYTAPGKPLGSHSQLAQVLMSLAYSAGGATGLILLKAFVLFGVALLLYRSARETGLTADWAALGTLAVMLASQSRLTARPQMFSYLCLALLALWLARYRAGRCGTRLLWTVPVLLVAWDYLHGSVYGVALLGAVVAAETVKALFGARLPGGLAASRLSIERLRPLWICAGVSLVAMAIHPNGLLNYQGFWAILSRNVDYAMYGEWLPTSFEDFPAFWVLFVLFAVVLLLRWRALDLTELLILLPFAYLSLRYNRAIFAYLIVALPIVARHLHALLQQWRQAFRAVRCAAPLLALGLATLVAYGQFVKDRQLFAFGFGLNDTVFPVGSARFVAAVGLDGNMYNMDGFGGYLAYFLAPERPIFHYNLPPVFEALPDFVHNPESRAQWQINYAIIGRADELSMFKRDGYVPVYWEPTGMVMLRPTPENQALITAHGIRFFQPLLAPERLEQMSRQPAVGERLCEEWADYLGYRTDPPLAEGLGQALLARDYRHDYATMARRLERAVATNPTVVPLRTALGLYLYRAGQLEPARDQFDRVLAVVPDHPLAIMNGAYLRLDLKDYAGALALFNRTLAADATNLHAQYGAAQAYLGLNDAAAAVRLLEQIVQSAPQSGPGQNARQYLEALRQRR